MNFAVGSTSGTGGEEHKLAYSLYDCMIDDVDPHDVIIETDTPNQLGPLLFAGDWPAADGGVFSVK